METQKTMTKRECVDFIINQMNKTQEIFMKDWKSTGSPHNEIKHENYILCKKICAQNGYVEGTFVELWNKAIELNGGKEADYLEAILRGRK